MDLGVLRDDMVDSLEHESKGCVSSTDLSVAMREVPRHVFLDDDERAYADRPVQYMNSRVLAPSTVGRLFEALDLGAGDETLLVGAGVGYTAAVAAEIAGPEHVQAVDITRRLVHEARRNLARADYDGVLVDRRDGADGFPEYAPYDRILVEAAAVRPPRALLDQLAPGGHLVMPLGAHEQSISVVHPDGDMDRLGGCAFGPMLVEGEQADTVERNRTRREEREFAERAARRRGGWEHEWIDWETR